MASERKVSSARPDQARLEPFYRQVASMVDRAERAFSGASPDKPYQIHAAISLFEQAALLAQEKFRDEDPALLEEVLRLRKEIYRDCLGLPPLSLEKSAELMEKRGSGMPRAVAARPVRPEVRRETEVRAEPTPERSSEPVAEERFDMGKAEEMIGSLKVRDARLGEMLASYSGLFRIRDVGLAPEHLMKKIKGDMGRLYRMMEGASEDQMRQIIRVLNALGVVQEQFYLEQRRAMAEARRQETAYSSTGAWTELVADTWNREKLDITNKEQFLHWFRGLMYEMLAERMGDPVDLKSYLTATLGVYEVRVDQVLDMVQTQTDFGLKEILKAEMDFLSATVIRRVKFVREWGDVDKQVEGIAKLNEEGKLVQLDAGKYYGINHFEKMTYRDAEGRVMVDEVPYAERFKNAMADYFILKRLWQDPLVAKENRDKLSPKELQEQLRELERLANLGVFGKPPRTKEEFEELAGKFVDLKEKIGLVKNGNAFLGKRGKAELLRLREMGYRDEELDFLKTPGANIFFKGHPVEAAPVRILRAQIAMHAGGYGNPADLTAVEREIIVKHDSFLEISKEERANFRPEVWQAWERGRLTEMAAYNLMFASGVASYLDVTGAGDTGFNLLVQTRRYFATQAGSARPRAAERIIKKIDRLMPTFFEAFLLQGRSLEEWFVDRRGKYQEIPWLEKGGLPENPDRPYGVSLSFALQVFKYMRQDEFVDFGKLVQPEPGSLGSGQLHIQREIVRQMELVWKAAFIWAVALALKNGDHRIFGEKGKYPMLDENGKPTNDEKKDSPVGLAKRVFKEIMLANLEHHVPMSRFGRLTGIGDASLGTMLSPEDEAALRNIFGNLMIRRDYDYEGRVVGQKGPLFEWGEVCNMLDSVGAGDAAYIRRLLGSR